MVTVMAQNVASQNKSGTFRASQKPLKGESHVVLLQQVLHIAHYALAQSGVMFTLICRPTSA